jgi:hypothetical protein
LIKVVKKTILIATCVMSFSATAAVETYLDKDKVTSPRSWSFITSVGYSNYTHMLEHDGQTPIMRLAFGKRLFSIQNIGIGIELGIQNGNTMDVDTSAFPGTGGIPVSTTIKPPLDLLATLKTGPLFNTPIFARVKSGIANYHWQFDNNDVMKNQLRIAGEVQAGLGYTINENFDLTVLYQGIYGGRPTLLSSSNEDNLTITNIPAQHGVLLSLTLNN